MRPVQPALPYARRCSSCPRPAVSAARDVRRLPDPSTVRGRWPHTDPLGPVKYGCDDHPVESMVVVVQGARP